MGLCINLIRLVVWRRDFDYSDHRLQLYLYKSNHCLSCSVNDTHPTNKMYQFIRFVLYFTVSIGKLDRCHALISYSVQRSRYSMRFYFSCYKSLKTKSLVPLHTSFSHISIKFITILRQKQTATSFANIVIQRALVRRFFSCYYHL